MKSLLVCLLLSVALCAAAQTTVTLPLVIKDATGKAVIGLQTSDFSVQAAKDISFTQIDEVMPATIGGDPAKAPIYVVFDATSVTSPLQGSVQQLLLELLADTTTRHEPITLLIYNGRGLQLIHDFSDDSDVLLAAVKRLQNAERAGSAIVPSTGDPEFEAKVTRKLDSLKRLRELVSAGNVASVPIVMGELAALEHLGALLEQSAKRKAVLWIGAMFPLQVDSGVMNFNSNTTTTMPEVKGMIVAYEKTVEMLNRAHVSIYPLQVSGGAPPMPTLSYADSTHIGFGQLARRTGGVNLDRSLDFPLAISEVRKDFGSYYLALFESTPIKKNPRWMSVRIEARKPSMKLRASDGFFAFQ